MTERTIMDYNDNWQLYRLDFILSRYPESFWKDKTVLELGAHNGYFGSKFQEYGAKVKCVEGRESNVKAMKDFHKNLDIELYDLDTQEWPWGHYDVIINFGLYYHLATYHKEHIKNCIENCDLMFFETRVVEAPGPALFYRLESGEDQAMPENNYAGTPTTNFVEAIFRNNQAKYELILDKKLNPDGSEKQNYLWKEDFHDDWRNLQFAPTEKRRFWIVNGNRKEEK